MNSICFISEYYPNVNGPDTGVFVRNLVWEMADMGIKVSVISPKLMFYKITQGVPYKATEVTPKGNTVNVYYPRFLFIPNILRLFLLVLFNLFTCRNACIKVIKSENLQPDCFYGHFIHRAGMCAVKLGEYFGKPSFVAFGEDCGWSVAKGSGIKSVRKILKNAAGMVAVSSPNRDYLIENRICTSDKTGLFVNGVQTEVFYPRDKREAREMFGLDPDMFIAAFAGSFIHRKGVLRLDEAVSDMDDIGVIYAGQGEQEPAGRHVLFKEPVAPEKMPFFYSAADVFVMPTLSEGCCNAIIEALACGLPVISSDLPFNHDILDESCAILIDPNDIGAIRDAVLSVKNDDGLRERLSRGALERAQELSLSKRAEGILQFMDGRR